MIACKKSEPWASSLLPLPLPPSFLRHLACALKCTINTENKCLLVSCYWPQNHADHAEVCSALTTLLLLYPDHLIILGGAFKGDLISPSDKSCHLRTRPYSRFQVPTLPTNTPTHHLDQATYIEHLLIHDPHNTTTQTHDTKNITHAFLYHDGVKATMCLPLRRPNPVWPEKNRNMVPIWELRKWG